MPKLDRDKILEQLKDPMFSREEILEKWYKELEEGIPIIYTGCSSGIVARYAERAGIDAIVVYETGLSRHWGMPTTMLRDPNTWTFKMFEEIKNVVNNTPIIAGLECYDPKYLYEKGLKRLLFRAIQIGFDGIQNFPTLAFLPYNTAALRDTVNMGWKRELEMVRLCKKLGIFTMWYACFPEQAKEVVEAGADVVVPHNGWTHGGKLGAPVVKGRELGAGIIPVGDKETAAQRIQEIIEAARSVRKDVICLAHGGPWATPEDVQYLFSHTDADGFEAASAFERIPLENAIRDTMKKFKSINLKRGK